MTALSPTFVDVDRVARFLKEQFSSSQTHGVKHFSLICAEEAQHLQLEPWAPTWEKRRI